MTLVLMLKILENTISDFLWNLVLSQTGKENQPIDFTKLNKNSMRPIFLRKKCLRTNSDLSYINIGGF